VLPKPRFNAPAAAPRHPRVTFRVVSTAPVDLGRATSSPRPRGLRLTGPDGSSAHLVVASDRYADRASGHVVGRLLLPSAAELIVRHGTTLTVDTYDHRLVVKVVGR
jgi:hypothetical protein